MYDYICMRKVLILKILFALPIAALNVPLTVQEALYPGGPAGVSRTNEPVCVGVPVADSAGIRTTGIFGLTGATAGQFRIIETWPSGNAKSIKTCGIVPTLSAGGTATITLTDGGGGNFGGANLATDNGSTITVATGAATFTVKKANFNILDSVVVGSTTVVASSTSSTRGLVLVGPDPTTTYPANVTCSPDSGGSPCATVYSSANDPNSVCAIDHSDNGPVMAVLKCTGTLYDGSSHPYMQHTTWMTFYQGKSYASLRVILRNANYNTSAVPSPDLHGGFNTAYKGIKSFEVRLGTTLSAVNFTLATNSGAQTGSLSGTDTAFIYEGQSNVQGFGGGADCTFGSACANLVTTDTGWTAKKNATVLASDASGNTCPAGYADMNDGTGVGLEIGTYQFCTQWPGSLEFLATGAEARIGLYSAKNAINPYIPWPYWQTRDVVLNFHTSAPNLANAFNSYQAFLVARATPAYYNSTNFFFNQMPTAAEEDAYYNQIQSNANPALSTSTALCAHPGGACLNDWTPNMYLEFWDWDTGGGGPFVQQDQRFNNLQVWLKRGMTGRYLDSYNFFRLEASRAWEHSDGTSSTDSTVNGWNWASRPDCTRGTPEMDCASQPTATRANGAKATVAGPAGPLKFDGDHQHWHGILDFYGLTGDQSILDGILPMKNYYLDRGSYAWRATSVGGPSRWFGLLMLNSAKLSELLSSVGDSDAAGVMAMGTQVYTTTAQPDLCVTDGVNNYPAGCTPGNSPGLSRVFGAYHGTEGSGYYSWCNGAGTSRVTQQFMMSIVEDGLIALVHAGGPSWTYSKEASDLAFGLAQYGMDLAYSWNGSTTMWQDPVIGCVGGGTGCVAANKLMLKNGVGYFTFLDNANAPCPAGTAPPYTLSDGKVYEGNSLAYGMQNQYSLWRWANTILGTLPSSELTKFQFAQQRVGDIKPFDSNFDTGGYATGEVIKSIYEPAGLALQSVTPTISETTPGSGTYNVSWTTPPGSTGTVRVKYSTTKQIVDWLGYDKFARTWAYNPATYINWFAASSTPDIAAAPGPQTLQVVTGKTGLSAANFSVKVMSPIGASGTSTPANLVLISGNNQSGTAGQALSNPFTVQVTDASSNPVVGVVVTFMVTAGGGTLSATSAVTNGSGLASSTLTLGSTAGANTVVAASGTLAGSPITFSATGVVQTPANLVLVSGNNQSGTTGQALANPFTVKVTDAGANPVAGVAVTFAVKTGGGTLSATSAVTNSSGLASSTLTLGSGAGANTVTATSGTLAGSPITFTATGVTPTPANLVLISGNNQSGAPGQTLFNPFTVEVTDSGSNPVAGVTVTFAVKAGGGTLSATSVVTNSSGLASSILTLGSTAGPNTVTATSGALAGSPITFSATGATGGTTTVTWVQQPRTAGWAGYNGYVSLRYDPVSQKTVLYGVPAGSMSIYSTDMFFYDAPTNAFLYLPIYSDMVDSCPASTPTQPGDRHPYDQMAIDTKRNVMWLYGGANQTCTGAMVNVNGTAVTWLGSGLNVFFPSWAGQQVNIAGTKYTVASVTDSTHLTLTTSAGVQNNVSLSISPYPPSYTYMLHLNANPTQDTWQRMPTPVEPDAGISSSMVYDSDDDLLFVFGTDGSSQTHNHWVYCPTDQNPTPGVVTAKQAAAGCTSADNWVQVSPTGGIRPQGTAGPGLVYDPDIHKVIRFGGDWGDGTTRNETWFYDVPSHTWTQKALSTTPPPVVNFAQGPDSVIVYNPNTHKILHHQATGPGAPADWEYDPVADTWTVLASTNGGPSGNVEVDMAYDPVNNVLVTHGYNNGFVDVWQGILSTTTISPPASVVLVSGNNQSGATGQALPSPFTVKVTDANSNPVPGVNVTFAVAAGGGSLSATSALSNGSGLASSTLTLGSTAGTNTVVATSGTLAGSPITFTATGSATVQTPANLVLVSGNNQSGTTGQGLGNPFMVKVTDAGSNPVAGVTVTFAVTAGGGSLSATSAVTDSSGLALSTLTLGSTAGTNTVTATSGTLAGSPITFTATGVAPPANTPPTPASLVLISGNNQSGTVGQALVNPFTVEVTDASSNPVAGVTVTFAVTAGGGTLSAASVVTNSSGLASSILTLGSTAGTNTVVATSGTLTGSPITFSAAGVAASTSTSTGTTTVTWVQQPRTAGWANYNAYLSLRYDPVSSKTVLYGVPAGSSSNYSTDLFFYDTPTNTFLYSPIYSDMSSSCPASTPTQPGDRSPFDQMAIDTKRNVMWMYGGSNSTCGGSTVNVNGTAVTWVSGGMNVFHSSWAGQQVNIAGTNYTVASVTNSAHLTLTASAGVQSNVSLSISPYPPSYTYMLHLNANPTLNTWQRMPTLVEPDAGTSSSMVYDSDDDLLFVFGTDGSSQTHNHWVYCPTDQNPTPGVVTAKQAAAGCTSADNWVLVSPTGGIRPQGTAGPGMVYDPDIHKVIRFGGDWGDGTTRNETWFYDVPTHTWTQKALSTTPPPVVNSSQGPDSVIVYNPNTHRILHHQAAGPGAPADWEYDPVADTWTKLVSTGAGPSSNIEVDMAYDPVNNVLVTHGFNNGYLDVWQGTLSSSTAAPNPCDLNGDGVVNNADVQIAISQVLPPGSCKSADLIGNGQCGIVDVQRIIDASMGQPCRTGQ